MSIENVITHMYETIKIYCDAIITVRNCEVIYGYLNDEYGCFDENLELYQYQKIAMMCVQLKKCEIFAIENNLNYRDPFNEHSNLIEDISSLFEKTKEDLLKFELFKECVAEIVKQDKSFTQKL